VGIFADIARTGDPVLRTIFRNGLGDGQDMRFVEVVARRAAAMAEVPNFTACSALPTSGFST
jgi:hypothetical protein